MITVRRCHKSFFIDEGYKVHKLSYDADFFLYYYYINGEKFYPSKNVQSLIIEMEKTEAKKGRIYDTEVKQVSENEHRVIGYVSKPLVEEEDTSLDKYYNYEVKIEDVRKGFPIKIRFVGFLINILLKYRRKDINMLKEYLTYL